MARQLPALLMVALLSGCLLPPADSTPAAIVRVLFENRDSSPSFVAVNVSDEATGERLLLAALDLPANSSMARRIEYATSPRVIRVSLGAGDHDIFSNTTSVRAPVTQFLFSLRGGRVASWGYEICDGPLAPCSEPPPLGRGG